jgi:hypothetical protein
MECVLCVGLVTCSHVTVMTHLYVFKKRKKKGLSQKMVSEQLALGS